MRKWLADMKENLIKISDYIESLERRIAALEARMIAAEQQNSALMARIEELEQRPAADPDEEPEVEVELIMQEDETEEDIPADEIPAEEDEPQQTMSQEEEKETVTEPVQEAVSEPEPEPEPQPAPAPEPAPEKKPEPAKSPTTGSLIGAPVKDIRQAISLGDRFLFQREIFGGNGELMQKTLESLNNLNSMQEATRYMDEHFSLDKDNPTTELFMNVMRRRFS